MSTATATVGGLGLGSASFLVLMVLKVMDLIDMHWFWVLTSILWVPVAAFLAVMSLVFGVVTIFLFIVWVVDVVVDGLCSLFKYVRNL